MLVAITTAECAQVTGILLVFTLMVAPAAAVLRLGLPPFAGLLCSALLAVTEAWAGLVLSWYTNAPVSFWIALMGGVFFVTAETVMRVVRRA